MICIRRAYDGPARGDGTRVLVDRIWPRGLSKAELEIDAWNRDVAPTAELRRWFGHDPGRWETFRRRYTEELDRNPDAVEPLLDAAERGNLTLVYGARDEHHNNARVLKEYLEEKLGS